MRPILLVLALAASAASAAPSYDYIDVSALGMGYAQGGAAPDDDAVGLRFRSSLAFDDEWFWTFEAGLVDYNAERGSLWKTGFGYAFPLDSIDIAVKVEYGRIDFGLAGGGGFAWDAQVRSANWEHFELNAHLGQGNVDPIDQFLRYGVGLLWTPGDSFGFTVEYDLGSGSTVDIYSYAVGVRWSF
jgi:hypothetical protein